MSFDVFISNAWRDHSVQPEQVANRLADGFKLIEKNEQIIQMARIITHIYGEHLGRWALGVEQNLSLKRHSCFIVGTDSERAINGFVAALELASGNDQPLIALGQSDRVVALATAASALVANGEFTRSHQLFIDATSLAQLGLAQDDSANRSLAVMANNIAMKIEGMSEVSQQQVELMVLASKTARQFWEIAGTWLEVERAEYRLSMTYLRVGENNKALAHAQNCLDISKTNHAAALELFFAFEAIARAEKARGERLSYTTALGQAKAHFEKLSQEDKKWCQESLDRISGD